MGYSVLILAGRRSLCVGSKSIKVLTVSQAVDLQIKKGQTMGLSNKSSGQMCSHNCSHSILVMSDNNVAELP